MSKRGYYPWADEDETSPLAEMSEGDLKKFLGNYKKMIDAELVSMPSDMLEEFMASEEFELYKIIGEQYGG